MKRIFVTTLFYLLVAINVRSQDTIRIYFDEVWNVTSDSSKATYYRKNFLNNNKVWEVRDYYISGKIQMTGSFKSKKPEEKHGHFVYYYENGNKSSEGAYLNNVHEGIWSYWENDGKLRSSGYYRQDKRNGKWTYWNFDGRIMMEGNYKNDFQDGEWYRYFPNEKLVLRFKDGILLDKSYGGMERRE